MLYLKDIIDDCFYIEDLDDLKIDCISKSELYSLVLNYGDMFIRGCFIGKNGNLVYRKLNINEFNFQKGSQFNDYFGLVVKTRYGQKSLLIQYKNYSNITCLFETGKIFDYSFSNFKKGYLPFKVSAHLGEVSVSTSGQKMILIDYIDSSNSTIQFEDGTLRYGISYGCFKKGQVKNPNLHIGETSFSNKGELMTIVQYRGTKDLDILFEDGTLVINKYYDHFLKGEVLNPNYYKNKYEGCTNTASNGQVMTIVEYISNDEVVIEFEDNFKTKSSVHHFLEGYVKNSQFTCNDAFRKSKLNEQSLSIKGQLMFILDYRSFKDIDIEFEDGFKVYHCRYDHFKNGCIYNPYCSKRSLIERLVSYYFIEFNIPCLYNFRPSFLEGMEFDIYIPSMNTAIEVDGYFHGNIEQFERDKRKSLISNKNNIKLIRIRDFCVNSINMDLSAMSKYDIILDAELPLCIRTSYHSFLCELNRLERQLFSILNIDYSCISYTKEILEECKLLD